MGYRSIVVIAIKKETYSKTSNKFKNSLKCCDNVYDLDDALVFFWSYVKWYPSEYDDFGEIEETLRTLDEEEYGFIRSGEELGDVEEFGRPYEFDIYIEKSVSGFEHGEKIEPEDFFALNSIKFIKDKD